MSKTRALVVCPGRGTYNKDELGYLHDRHAGQQSVWQFIDDYRESVNQPTVSELDAMDKYSMKLHTLGEHASPLIYACSLADFASIDRNELEIVAVTGNSMGWYSALSIAGALQKEDAITLIDTMGSMMKSGVVGGQLIYPYIDDQWVEIPGRKKSILQQVEVINLQRDVELYLSIDLGGYLVIAGNNPGMKAFEQTLPNIESRFPMRLYNHAAFHTPMLKDVSAQAFSLLGNIPFQKPEIPLVDGRGHQWTPFSCNTEELKKYTLGHQVYKPYDFAKAVEVAIKEYAPEQIVVLGPGTTLGSSVAHTLIKQGWPKINSKSAFKLQQKIQPVVVSMGMD